MHARARVRRRESRKDKFDAHAGMGKQLGLLVGQASGNEIVVLFVSSFCACARGVVFVPFASLTHSHNHVYLGLDRNCDGHGRRLDSVYHYHWQPLHGTTPNALTHAFHGNVPQCSGNPNRSRFWH